MPRRPDHLLQMQYMPSGARYPQWLRCGHRFSRSCEDPRSGSGNPFTSTCHIYVSFFHTKVAMRTNIDIDDALIAEAMAVSGLTTMRAVIEEALRRLVRQKQQEQTLALYGTVDWEGDLEQN